MRKMFLAGLVALVALGLQPARAQESKLPYANNFEKEEAGKIPADFLVIDGEFAVKEDNGNKVLELPGAPLDTFSLLFGPTLRTNVAASVRVFGTTHGRRYPTFAVGLNGQGGYRLQVSPAKKLVELYKGDDVIATADYEWKTGKWTTVKIQTVSAGAAWKIQGKVWTEGDAEPSTWTVSYDETKEPTAGRASIWGSPFATTPIDYDDLSVTAVNRAK